MIGELQRAIFSSESIYKLQLAVSNKTSTLDEVELNNRGALAVCAMADKVM